jgi:hypothetical protein
MKLNKLTLMALLLIAALLVAACGGGDDDDGGDGGDGGESNLSESFTATDPMGTTITVNYPEGWVADGSGSLITIASSQEVLTAAGAGSTNFVPGEGEIALIVTVFPAEMAGALGESPEAVVTSLGATASEAGQNLEGEPETFEADGRQGAYQAGSITADEQTGDLAIAVITLADGGFALATGVAAEGQIAQYEDEIKAIAGSITYSADGGAAGEDDMTEEADDEEDEEDMEETDETPEAEATDAG